jgi:hypothetical protein
MTVPISDQIKGVAAALDTLRFVQKHSAGLRTLIAFLQAADAQGRDIYPDDAQRADLMKNPAVAAVVAAFPEASMSILPVRKPAPDHIEQIDEEDAA